MKFIYFTFTFLYLFTATCKGPEEKLSGPAETREWKGDFESIDISSAIEAEIIKSDTERVVITAPRKLLEKVDVQNSGGQLSISMKPVSLLSLTRSDAVKAKIYATDFTELKVGSAASVDVKDKFLSENMRVAVSSSGELSGHLEANEFHLDVSSSGSVKGNIWAINLYCKASSTADIDVKGIAEKALIEASSAAKFDGEDFVAEAVEAEASSSGEIIIGVKNSLNAQANSAGTVQYKVIGNNLMSYKDEQNSGGSVKKID